MNDVNEDSDFFLKFKDEAVFNDKKSIEECFKYFDKNCDGALDIHEFEDLLKKLFNFNGNPNHLSSTKIEKMFNFFDSRKEGKHNINDFENFWFKIVKQSLFPRTALVIVDVQNDFIDGRLSLKNCSAKQDGGEVVPVINQMINDIPFDVIVYTLDWHPEDHCSFIENLHMRQLSSNSPKLENIQVLDTVIFEAYPDVPLKLWPAHCIQDSNGARLHPNLIVVDEKSDPMKRNVVYTKKGCKSDIDSYSAFFDNCKLNETSLNSDLQKHGITEIYVCGLAADVCVAATSYDGLGLNYRVAYVEDACRGVDLKDIEYQKDRLIKNGAIMVNSKQVNNMVTCRDRRPELAYATFSAISP